MNVGDLNDYAGFGMLIYFIVIATYAVYYWHDGGDR